MKAFRVIVVSGFALLTVLALRSLTERRTGADQGGTSLPSTSGESSEQRWQSPGADFLEGRARRQAVAHRERGAHAGGPVDPDPFKQNHEDWRGLLQEALRGSDDAKLLSLLSAVGWGQDAVKRGELHQAAARSLAAGDPKRGAKLLGEMTDLNDRLLLASHMTLALLDKDAKEAVKWAGELADPMLAGQVHEVLARDWSGRDLDGTLEWIGGLGDAALQTKAAEGLMWTWAQSDIREAVDWAMQLEDSPVRDAVFLKTSKILATTDAAAAVQWSSRFPEGSGRDSALNFAMSQWAEKDVSAAGTWALSLADAAIQKTALTALSGAWANREPDRAAAWLLQLPPETRADALPVVASKWAARDAPAAVAWIKNLPDDAERKRLMSHLGAIFPQN